MGDPKAAAVALREAVEIGTKLVAEQPNVVDYRYGLATSLTNLGFALADLGDRRAGAAYREAIDGDSRLASMYPGVPEYQVAMANAYNNLAIVQGDHADGAGAEASARKAIKILTAVVSEHPECPGIGRSWATRTSTSASRLARRGRPAEAIAENSRAIEVHAALVASHPEVPEYRESSGRGRRGNLGVLLAEAGIGTAPSPRIARPSTRIRSRSPPIRVEYRSG